MITVLTILYVLGFGITGTVLFFHNYIFTIGYRGEPWWKIVIATVLWPIVLVWAIIEEVIRPSR